MDLSDKATLAETKKIFREMLFLNGIDPETLIEEEINGTLLSIPKEEAGKNRAGQEEPDGPLVEDTEDYERRVAEERARDGVIFRTGETDNHVEEKKEEEKPSFDEKLFEEELNEEEIFKDEKKEDEPLVTNRQRLDTLTKEEKKDGGEAGGFAEKAAAARETGAKLIVLRRPEEEGLGFDEVLNLCITRLRADE